MQPSLLAFQKQLLGNKAFVTQWESSQLRPPSLPSYPDSHLRFEGLLLRRGREALAPSGT